MRRSRPAEPSLELKFSAILTMRGEIAAGPHADKGILTGSMQTMPHNK
jgi:hypothetical protein